ncbi:MAG: hypothetical protein ACYTGZ_08320, partial [Planctomycetota bacterium]
PVRDVRLALADEGTQTLLFERRETWTDAAGRARVPVYARDPVSLLYRDRTSTRWKKLRSFDPAGGDARVELRLPRARWLRLTVERGGDAVPDDRWSLYVGRERVEPLRGRDGAWRVPLRQWDDDGKVAAHLLARDAEPVSREFSRDTGECDWNVALRPSTRLAVHVRRADEEQSFRLVLADPTGAKIASRGPWRYRLEAGPDGVVRDVTLPAGRYVLLDLVSGLRSAPFVAPAGGTNLDLTFDLSHARRAPKTAAGRIVAPEGFDFARTNLEALPGGTIRVDPDGRFRLPWPAAGGVELRATHPDLPAAGEVRTFAVTASDAIRVPLAPIARVRCDLDASVPTPASGSTTPRVIATDENGSVVVVDAQVAGGELRFAGLAPGTWALRFDLPGRAPAAREGVVLTAGDNDLGPLALPRGSTLRFRVSMPAGALAPELVVSAQAVATPRYQRSLRTKGEPEFALPGLGAGRFRVTAWDRYTGLRVFSGSVACDGVADREITVSMR